MASAFLYVIAGWLLFNVAIAIGMYFRPTRKRPPAPAHELERPSMSANVVVPGSPTAPLQPLGHAVFNHVGRTFGRAARLLLFGFRLGEEHRSSSVEKRELT